MCALAPWHIQNDDADHITMLCDTAVRPSAIAVNDVAAADAPIRRAQQCGRETVHTRATTTKDMIVRN